MDISYSLAMEDHARINPLQGLEALAEKLLPAERKMQPVPSKAEVKDQNASAAATLQGIMAGIKGGPKVIGARKPRKRKGG